MPKGLRPAAVVWFVLIAALPFARTELVQSIVAILAVLVGLPTLLAGLLDVVRDHDESARTDGPATLAERLALVPARVVVGLLGASGVVIGLGIIAWVLYNLLVERQPEFTGADVFQPLGIGPLLVVVGVALVRSALGRDAVTVAVDESLDFDD